MDSETCPSCSSASRRTVVAAETTTFCCRKRLNPTAVISIRYTPGGRLGTLYSPPDVVVALVTAFVSRLTTLSSAPGKGSACWIGNNAGDVAALTLRVEN